MKDPSNVVDKSGQAIEEFSAESSDLAFESDSSNLADEKWDEYWLTVEI